MSLARSLERRLERLFEGAAGRVFSGRLHPSEMAGRIAREADLSRYRHESGPATANKYVLTVNPEDLDVDPSTLERKLERALAEHAAGVGLLFEGPRRKETPMSTNSAIDSVTLRRYEEQGWGQSRIGFGSKVYRGATDGDPLGPVPGVETTDRWITFFGTFGFSF